MLSKPNIMVVENNIAVLNRINQLLTNRSYNVITVESCWEALNIIQKNPGGVDIVLLSLEMPRLGAMPLIETLQKTRSEILIMAMSADCGEEAIEAMHAGAYDCIRKTFTTERFWTKINRVIERFHLNQELEKLKREKRSAQGYGPDSMQAIFDSLADGILVTDLHNNLVFCNPRAADMLNLSRDEDLGRPVQDLIRHKELEKLLVNTARLKNATPGHHEVCLLEMDGKQLRTHISPVINRDGAPIGTVTLIHDVIQISVMDSLKDDFIFMVSHQLKSPLSSMLMQLSVVVDGLAGDLTAKQKDLLGKAKEKTKGMIILVNDLLDFRRIEEGKILQQIERLDLQEILQRTIDLMAMSSEDKDITIETHVDDHLPFITGDKTGIEAVFVNIISNAIKYTPAGGRVTINIYKSGNDVCIKVVDTGIGIAPEDIHRIFDRFYRGRSETTRAIAGSGLGLSIVKRIVDLHKGTVYIESKENQGTTFLVSLPVTR